MIRLALVIWLGFCSAAGACSLCSSPINRATLGEEMDLAPVAVYGWLSDPRLNPPGQGSLGGGTTLLHVEKVLKDEAGLGASKQVTLSRYVPVPDPKKPPHYLVFLDKRQGGFEPLTGVFAKSPELLAYIAGARPVRAQGRVAALVYCARFLDHADEAIAQDAFFEFAKSRDADVGQAGRQLDPAHVRRLLQTPNLDADRLSLFAFLLGCCGQTADGELLARLGKSLTGEQVRALDGVLAGYVNLRPREGWDAVHTILANPKQPFASRLAAWRSIRFIHGWKAADVRAEILKGMAHVVADAELTDLGVEDLRRWRMWELTPQIVRRFEKATDLAPIVRNSMIRYALECPLPQARDMVAQARRIDPEYVADQERLLADLRR